MESLCEKCLGAAVPAAQMKTFEHEGCTLHCLAFVSSCIVCGHRWQDQRYTELNSHHVERACTVATSRSQNAHEAQLIFGLGHFDSTES
jgi:hypothetical protein